MSTAVSVVVPVWNPGPNLRRCVESLLAQTMPSSEYEIVLVDDGSTDGTAQRLDALATAHPDRVRVIHIPASGWPGRPRNVGIDAAVGEYVHLVDNDDVLPPYALKDLCAAAREVGADVAMGRPVSDFRGLNHTIYRRTIRSCTLAEFPQLTESLTPHKMFRRAFLHEHGIRFPEGPVPLEDQPFVMRAFLHAKAVTLLCDRPYYYYLRRVGWGRNAGDRRLDPVQHCAAVDDALQIVEDALPDSPLRDVIYRRFYRVNLLPRIGSLSGADEQWQRLLVSELRRVAAARLGGRVHAGLGVANRVQSRLLLDDDLPRLVALGEQFRRITTRAAARNLRWQDGRLVLDVDAVLCWGDAPLRCERSDVGWLLPAALAPGVPAADRMLDPERDQPDVELTLTSRVSSLVLDVGDGLRVGVDDEGEIRVSGEAAIDPQRAFAGAPLDDGLWDVHLRVRYGAWSRAGGLRVDPGELPTPHITADGRVVRPYPGGSQDGLVLDVGQWLTPVAAALAPSCALSVEDGRLLRLALAMSTDAPAPAQLLLEPAPGTAGGLVECGALLSPDAVASVARVPLPPLPRRGSWRAWLRVADGGVGQAVALPWRLRSAAGRLRIERQVSGGDGSTPSTSVPSGSLASR